MKKNYIGLANSFHDSALAIVNHHGEVVFAEATERYLQYKRAVNIMPALFKRTSELIEAYCDSDADIVAACSWSSAAHTQLNQLDRLCNPSAFARQNPSAPLIVIRDVAAFHFFLVSQIKAVVQPLHTLEYELSQMEERAGRGATERSYEHHRTHAATACFSSRFSEAACAVLDGYGEGRSSACYFYRDGHLTELPSPTVERSTSLGGFYSDVCDACGFANLTGEEWKVMGLASYGHHNDQIYRILREMIQVNGLSLEAPIPSRSHKLRQDLHRLRRRTTDPPFNAADIAFAGQQVFTEVLLEFLSNLHNATGVPNLVLSGGCALNSSANGHILTRTPFKSLHVSSAPADDGNAIGAALLAFQEDHPDYCPSGGWQTPYLGSSMSRETLNNFARFSRSPNVITHCKNPPQRAAEMLASGKLIGWIQGRAEFGPRALGNRSILADPRSEAIKAAINSRVKFREEFRPFAPSILHDFGHQYFENYQESPYMERTLTYRQEVRNLVPGAVHHDGTGRLQTVKREWNESFYLLVNSFYQLTGIPLVINTSYNIMGKPIVHSVEDVVAVFSTTDLDAVFINDLLIMK